MLLEILDRDVFLVVGDIRLMFRIRVWVFGGRDLGIISKEIVGVVEKVI